MIKNMSIKGKLILGFGFTLCGAIVVVISLLNRLRTISANYYDLLQEPAMQFFNLEYYDMAESLHGRSEMLLNQATTTWTAMIILSFVVLATGILIAIFIGSSILKPIRQVLAAMDDLQKGN